MRALVIAGVGLALCGILMGCLAYVDTSRWPTQQEKAYLNSAKADWELWFGDIGQECEANFESLRVASYPSMGGVEGQCGLGTYGCYRVDASGPFGVARRPTLFYAEGYDTEFILYHEFAHWALDCTTGDPQPKHTNKRVWSCFAWNIGEGIEECEHY